MQHVKNLKICPRKFQNAQENFEKKWARKIFSTQEKKPKKGSKNWFLWQFSFSRVKKKHWTMLPRCNRGEDSGRMTFLIQLNIEELQVVIQYYRSRKNY